VIDGFAGPRPESYRSSRGFVLSDPFIISITSVTTCAGVWIAIVVVAMIYVSGVFVCLVVEIVTCCFALSAIGELFVA
jgi:hypothetical protein